MTKQEQIKEMAKAMGDFKLQNTYECDIELAEHLYNKGYRKEQETTREFAEKVKEYINNKVIADFDDSESVKYYTVDLDEFESEIDELLKEYKYEKL